MRVFILLACLVAIAFSYNYWEDVYRRKALRFNVPKYTCDRHVVMRCFNEIGEEVDEFGYPVEGNSWRGRISKRAHPWL